MLGQCEIYFGRCVSRDAMKQRDWLILLLYFLWCGFNLFQRFFDIYFSLVQLLEMFKVKYNACKKIGFDRGFDQKLS